MPSRALQSLTRRGMPSPKRRIIRRRGRKSRSPTTDDEDRIVEDYIKQKYINSIVSKKTSMDAIKSLLSDPQYGDPDDFANFFKGINVGNLVERLYNQYAPSNIERIREEEVRLKSGRVRSGFRVSKNIYLIPIKTKKTTYIQARSFKTGRAVKLRKSYLRKLK